MKRPAPSSTVCSDSGEATIERVAANQFNRGRVFDLQFQPLKALPHYEKAYRYRPDHFTYVHAYADTLQANTVSQTRNKICQATLKTLRQLAKANTAAYPANVAMTLNNLAILYRDTQRLQEAEEAYPEALMTYRQLAKANAPAYLPNVATILNNLAILYRQTQRLQEAEEAYQEALMTYRQLAKANAAAYSPMSPRS